MLDRKLAQKIADEVMKNLGYNINVMNEQAIIIGSGNPKRINTFHETAMQAIKQQETREVSESDAEKLKGVKPGINMPIVNKNNTVIGVVGITGSPEEVRNIGKLVKMTAELIIEQQETLDRLYSHRNDKEMLMNALISEESMMLPKEIEQWGKNLGYDFSLNRIALIIVPNTIDLQTKAKLESMLSHFKRSKYHSKQDISSIFSNKQILIFKTLSATAPWEIEKEIHDYVAMITKESEEIYQCFVGGFYPALKGYAISYREAYNLSQQIKNRKNETGIDFAHDHYLLKVYNTLDPSVFNYVVKPYVTKIRQCFGKGTEDAMRTMQLLFDYNFHYDHVAKEMFIHKNTVIFRKKKMDDCLGFSIKDYGDKNILFLIVLKYFQKFG